MNFYRVLYKGILVQVRFSADNTKFDNTDSYIAWLIGFDLHGGIGGVQIILVVVGSRRESDSRRAMIVDLNSDHAAPTTPEKKTVFGAGKKRKIPNLIKFAETQSIADGEEKMAVFSVRFVLFFGVA